jgi:DNA-directed RNA polymerase specialized sigma24 family protein
LRLTKNRDDAEELVADTVAKAWAHRDSLHDAQYFSTEMPQLQSPN